MQRFFHSFEKERKSDEGILNFLDFLATGLTLTLFLFLFLFLSDESVCVCVSECLCCVSVCELLSGWVVERVLVSPQTLFLAFLPCRSFSPPRTEISWSVSEKKKFPPRKFFPFHSKQEMKIKKIWIRETGCPSQKNDENFILFKFLRRWKVFGGCDATISGQRLPLPPEVEVEPRLMMLMIMLMLALIRWLMVVITLMLMLLLILPLDAQMQSSLGGV